MTAGMSGALVQRLEMLSGYREAYPPGDPCAAQNPVAWSHWRLSVAGRTASVLSRVCSAGMDYTQRTNTFAHHIVLDAGELVTAGPAWVMLQPNILQSAWSGAPRLLPQGRAIPNGDGRPQRCDAWEGAAGDAGWAGVFAETALTDPTRIAYLIYPPGIDPLVLVGEALALLPERQRWFVTFSTYFSELPAGLSCTWRCCLSGTAAAQDARKLAASGVVIDLTQTQGRAPDTPLVNRARSGAVESAVSTAVSIPGVQIDRLNELPQYPKRSLIDESHPPAEVAPPVEILSVPAAKSHADVLPIPEPNAAARFSAVFYVVAVLWPLLAVAGVLAWHFQAIPSDIVALKGQVADLKQSKGTLESELEASKAANTAEQKRTSDAEAKADGAAKKAADAAQLQAKAEGAKKTAEDQTKDAAEKLERVTTGLKDAKEKLTATEKQRDDLQVQLATKTTPASNPAQVASAASTTQPSYAIVDVCGTERTLYEASAPLSRIELVFCAAKPPDISFEPTQEGQRIVLKRVSSTQPTSAGGSADNAVATSIASISLSRDRCSVIWKWTNADVRPSKELSRWLQAAAVAIDRSGVVLTQIQLGRPIPITCVLNNGGAITPLPAAKPGSGLRLLPPSAMGSNWKVSNISDNDLRFSLKEPVDAEFDVIQDKEGIRSTWAELYRRETDVTGHKYDNDENTRTLAQRDQEIKSANEALKTAQADKNSKAVSAQQAIIDRATADKDELVKRQTAFGVKSALEGLKSFTVHVQETSTNIRLCDVNFMFAK